MQSNSLNFHRLNLSPYHGEKFVANEIKLLDSIGISHEKDPYRANILISNTHTDFLALLSSPLNNLEILIHPNSGYDNFPIQFVDQAKFPIFTGNTIRSHAVAEYIISKLLNHFCSIAHHSIWKEDRKWPRPRLADQEVLIIGHGIIGKILEKSLEPIVSKIKIFDPYQGHKYLDLPNTDIVLVAAGLNPSSHRLIDTNFLKQLNPNWVLINAARGKIINQSDLLKELKLNLNSHAYLDVFESEPFQDLDLPNLTCSSHMAGVTDNLDQLILNFEAEILSQFVTQRSNIVELEVKYSNLLLKNRFSPDRSFLI